MRPDNFYVVSVLVDGEWIQPCERVLHELGDAVDEAMRWPEAKEIGVRLNAGSASVDATGSVFSVAICAVLNTYDFYSDSPPDFPKWCEQYGNRAWRRSLANIQANEAHVATERRALAVGAFG